MGRFVDRASMLVECVLPVALEATLASPGGVEPEEGQEVCRQASLARWCWSEETLPPDPVD